MQRSSGNIVDPAPKLKVLLFSSAGGAGNYRSGRPAPLISRARAVKKESAVKPGSVVDSHSSGMRVAAQL